MSAPGYFGQFGGRFVAETLVPALEELDAARLSIVGSEAFQRKWRELLRHYVGRPTPLSDAGRLCADLGTDDVALLALKREDLCHTGAHKINNAPWSGAPGQGARQDGGSLPRPAPGNTALQPPRQRRCSTCPARSTWGKRTWRGKLPTCFACGC